MDGLARQGLANGGKGEGVSVSAQHRRIRAKRTARALILALAVGLVAPLGLVSASSAGAARRADESMAVVPPGAGSVMPGIDARLLGLPLLPGAALGADASADLAVAQTRLAAITHEQDALNARQADLTARSLKLTAVQQQAEAELKRTQELVNRVAAAAYRSASDELLAVLPSSNMLDLGRRMKLAGQAGTSLRAISRRAAAARRAASKQAEATGIEAARVQQRLGELAAEAPAAKRMVEARVAQAGTDLPARKLAGLGIPVAAMDAYLRAERTMAFLQPTCGIQWWLLAGIADGESGHGTHGGARADVHGDVFPPIIGIPLDGTNHTQAIGDTDHGLYDLDPIWDRAVGVLQFIPGTWKGWASDGNGDGRMDPQNLYDASLGAAKKLCADAGPEGLHTDEQLAGALKPYAVTNALVKAKLARARAYELQGIPKPDPTVAGAITPGEEVAGRAMR
jgi:membrane-bound lytic murein transglycosylase B